MYSTVTPGFCFSNALRPSSMFCFSSAEPQAILVSLTGWPEVAGAAAAGLAAVVGAGAAAGAVVGAGAAAAAAAVVGAGAAAAGFVGSGLTAAGLAGAVVAVGAGGEPQAAVSRASALAPMNQ